MQGREGRRFSRKKPASRGDKGLNLEKSRKARLTIQEDWKASENPKSRKFRSMLVIPTNTKTVQRLLTGWSEKAGGAR